MYIWHATHEHKQKWDSWLDADNEITLPCYNELSQNKWSYRKVSNIRRTKSQNLNASRLTL